MILVGPNRSPYTRRVAIVLNAYGMAYEQQPLSGFDDREKVRAFNPLGRIPALVLDDGELLVDSGAIIDHLDERQRAAHGPDSALVPESGVGRRAVLRLAAVLMGVCDKGLQAAYERNHRPADKVHQTWIDDCIAQIGQALAHVESGLEEGQRFLLRGRLTHADIAAVIAERFTRGGLKIDTAARMPRLFAMTQRLATEERAFTVAEHPR
jgi:glutathione S-transferase